ncbi:hypothetical protein BH18THE2_BH18THE2_39070 [soil metagenome]
MITHTETQEEGSTKDRSRKKKEDSPQNGCKEDDLDRIDAIYVESSEIVKADFNQISLADALWLVGYGLLMNRLKKELEI